MFYGPDVDARTEEDRAEREAHCKAICGACPMRLQCLEDTIVVEVKRGGKDFHGVAGGMGTGERKKFVKHLKEEGYDKEVPKGLEFIASLTAFYAAEISRKLRGVVTDDDYEDEEPDDDTIYEPHTGARPVAHQQRNGAVGRPQGHCLV